VRMRDLLAEIQRLLPSPSATMNVTPELGATPMPMIDYAQALDRVGGDRELLAELAALFLDEYPRLMSEALAGLDNNDLAAASGAAHQLKGLLAQFGSEKGRELALAVEAAAKSGSAGDARRAHAQLSSHLEEIRGTLLRMSRGEEIV